MPKKALIIFNPSAGMASKVKVEQLAEAALKSNGYVADIFIIDKKFETRINGYDFSDLSLVVAIGGDGTVKVAGRTMIQNKCAAPLLIIPFGSANVVAKSLGVPLNPREALKLLESESYAEMDVGLINKTHYFLVGFSVGYISRIITGTTTRLKNRFGFLGYLISIIFNVNKITRQKFKIVSNRREYSVKGNSLVVFNACNFYGLKGKKEISPSDGILNLYVVTNKNFLTLMRAFFHFLLYSEPTQYLFNLDGDGFKIVINRLLRSCQIDGDYVSIGKEINIKILPKALKVKV